MKATEQYFPVVMYIMPYKVVLTFESVDDVLILHTVALTFDTMFEPIDEIVA